ncbi:MAG: ABC transporter ATP-binding protein [Candidatus Saccharibacteria bacterium]|nr:ABC transporter ATP-binding protein [Candidatus Saccharibacteria bacterium]
MKIIEAKNIKKSFNKNTMALRGADFAIEEGEIVAVVGASGSGKSTLLHCLAGILKIDSGEVLFEGKNIGKMSDKKRNQLRREKFGFVFQFSQLVPELTALDNVALPLLINGVKKAEAYAEAKSWLKKVGLAKNMNQNSGELSGGQAQRVAIARAMIIKPKILFADEPTGSLDSINSEKVMELFITTAKENNTTVIMVTHEATIAAYADREVIVRDGVVMGEK